jgi:hypothetical protein
MNLERTSSIHKVTGGTQEQREKIQRDFEDKFSKQNWYVGSERDKTPEEKELIEIIINKLKEFLTEYGVLLLDLKEDHVHMIDKSKMSLETLEYVEKHFKDSNKVAYFHKKPQQEVIILDWQIKSPLELANTLVHEFIHFLSFNSVKVKDENTDDFIEHRTGLTVESSKGEKAVYFKEINEAITEELTERFMSNLKEIYFLAQEYEQVIEAREKLSNPYISSVFSKENKAEYISSYEKPRKNLNALIKQIYERRKDEFVSEEEVFKVFVKAAMTGEVKELAFLIETTLGSGMFKKIAQSLIQFDK